MKRLICAVVFLYTTVFAYGAELSNASWIAGSNLINTTNTYTFTYEAVTDYPYYAFYATFPPGFSCAGLSNVSITVDGNPVEISGISMASGAMIRLNLVNPNLVENGALIVVKALVTNASTTGVKNWTCIRTATSTGSILDEISDPDPIVLLPPVADAPVATITSTITTNSFRAFWNTTANATSYEVDLSTKSDFSAILATYNDFNVGNVFTYVFTGLAPATTYYYRVRAVNVSGTSASSNALSITTNKSVAAVVLTNLSKVYDGTAKQPSANSSPSGLAMTYTFNGSPVAPTNVGSYAVVGTVNDPAYQGSASGTMVITKGLAAVSINNLNFTYDGSPKAVTATTLPAGLNVDFTYNGSSTIPTELGSYAVEGVVSDVNYQGTVSGTLIISKGNVMITLSGLSKVYDGATKPVTITTVPAGLPISVTYNGVATVPYNAGTYAVAVSVNDGHYDGFASGTLTIAKATASISFTGLNTVYDGTAKTIVASTTPANIPVSITYNGSLTAPANAGNYNVVATINHNNYQGIASGDLTIEKATAFVALSDLSVEYDGACKPASINTSPSNLDVEVTYDGSATVPASTGIYEVIATIKHQNYKGISTGQLTISKVTSAKNSINTEVKIYPNPVSDFVKVETSVQLKNIQLVDPSGAMVASRESASMEETLDVRHLPKGAYLLLVESVSGKDSYHLILH